MSSSSSPKSVLSAKKSSKPMYKWLLIGLLIVLGIILIVSLARAKREGFEGGAGTLMYFYMPECGHCKKFMPEWEKLQPMIDADRVSLKLNKIDGTEDSNKDLVNQYGIQGFPTLVLEIGGKSSKYDGERKADAVLAWAKKQLAA